MHRTVAFTSCLHHTLTLSLTLLSCPPQCQYELLPPSLARFSPTDPDTILYTGFGMERCVQFYSLSQNTVVRTSALTHWATCMDVSPQGHLLAFGCQGKSGGSYLLCEYSSGRGSHLRQGVGLSVTKEFQHNITDI